ncbi:MAG: response regulator [Candidatus Brocadiales bacterium]|nr:response regulator [Candidatus Brocadiales bacterium]
MTAKDGCEAVKKAKEHSPDLIVMDIIMPKIDGIERWAGS